MSSSVPIASSCILVTGGAGFIGSHLVKELVRRGAEKVIVVDSLRHGNRANLGALGDRVEIVQQTLGIDPPEPLARALEGVSAVFHLAAEKHNRSKDDLSTAERLIGWRATTTLDEGLERTHAWMQGEAKAAAT